MGQPRPGPLAPDCRALPRLRVLPQFRPVHEVLEPSTVSADSSPEDVRLLACGPREVTLYSRPGCHLCEEAKAAIAPLLGAFCATLREVNIDEDAVLQERYGGDKIGRASCRERV